MNREITALVLILSFVSIVIAPTACAENFSFKLLANQSSIDGGFETILPFSESDFKIGINGIYNNDDYKILFAKAELANQIFTEGLTGGLGFKGGWGEAEKAQRTGDLLNIGFVFSLAYDLSKADFKKIPIVLSSSVCVSPEPLCFNDSEKFLELLGEVDWMILENAAVVLAYRYIKIDFDKPTQWKKSDSNGYVGLKFSF